MHFRLFLSNFYALKIVDLSGIGIWIIIIEGIHVDLLNTATALHSISSFAT